MKAAPVRNPADVLKTLIASEVEIIRNRDPELSAALDVPATVLKSSPAPAVPALEPSLPRRALRKVYRTLDRVGPLRPVLQRVRSRVLVVLDRAPQPPTSSTGQTSVQRSYTIAFTMRSGSNELCNLLAKNGLGSPGEFFQKRLPGGPGLVLDSFSKVINHYQRQGVFGSKMSHDHRAALDEQLRMAIPHYTRIDDVLPNHRWVWLVRQDKILQAISWCRAETSNRWAEPGEAKTKVIDYNYDFIHILSRVMMIFSAELAWEMYFRENRIEPFKIVYEELFRDVDQELKRLVDYLGGPGPGRKSLAKSSTFAVQRNEQSYALRQRFVNDLARLGSEGLTRELGKPLNTWVRFFFERGWLA
jgi:trehalose 2-sulfotransferase